jgi:hypothetical protein
VFSDSAIKANTANRLVTNGWELTLGANLQFKLGPVVVRSAARLVNGNLALRPGDTVYYDQLYDVLAPNRGWFFTNDLDVLYQGLENKLIVGARYTFTAPLYDSTRHLDPTAASTTVDNSTHRVGPLIGYTFKMEDGAKFNTPTVFLLVQWWVKHRWRTGADTPAALPLIGIGFQITGDFLSVSTKQGAALRAEEQLEHVDQVTRPGFLVEAAVVGEALRFLEVPPGALAVASPFGRERTGLERGRKAQRVTRLLCGSPDPGVATKHHATNARAAAPPRGPRTSAGDPTARAADRRAACRPPADHHRQRAAPRG